MNHGNRKISSSFDRRTFLKMTGIVGVGSVLAGGSMISMAGCSSADEQEGEQVMNQNDTQTTESAEYTSIFPEHEALGTGIGAMPGRVAWVYDPASVTWDGITDWWELSNYNEAVVRTMVSNAIACAAGAENASLGWKTLFEYHNKRTGASSENQGYQPGQIVAIKCNMNGAAEYNDDTSGADTGDLYTNPVLLKCLLSSLVEDAGVAPSDIVCFDTTRIFPDFMVEYCTQDNLSGVHFADRKERNPDRVQADSSARIEWSGAVRGVDCFYPTCVTEADYLINFADLKGHGYGITLCAKNHFGSFCNSSKMRQPQEAGLHPFLSNQEMGDYSPLVDLMGSRFLESKTVLYILGALVSPAQNTRAATTDISTWSMEPFNGGYTASVFMSQDPVAIDSVGADFLINEPNMTGNNASLDGNAGCENYLHEAACADNPPSGATYLDGTGNLLASLGVHEHWNNAVDKQYGRNLGKPEGIELVRV